MNGESRLNFLMENRESFEILKINRSPMFASLKVNNSISVSFLIKFYMIH